MITPEQARSELILRELMKRKLESSGRRFGEIRRIPSFREKAVREVPVAFARSFPPAAIYQHPELLPLAGQTAGGLTGGLAGAVSGAGVGRGGQEIIESIKERRFPRFGQVAPEMARTAAIEGAFRGTGKLLRPIANRLIQSALKASPAIREKYPELGFETIKEGIYGTRGQMLKKSRQIIKKGEQDLQKLLSTRPEKVNLENVVSELREMKRRAANIGDETTLAQLDKFERFILSKGGFLKGTELQPTGFVIKGEGRQISPKLIRKREGVSTSFILKGEGKQSAPKKIIQESFEHTPGEQGIVGEIRKEPSIRIIKKPKIVQIETTQSRLPLETRTANIKTKSSIIPEERFGPFREIRQESFIPRETKTPQYLIRAEEANQLKRDLYDQISDSAFLKKLSDLSDNPEMFRRAAKGLRKEIIGGIPEAGKIDKSLATAIKAKKALSQEEARSLGRVILPYFETAGAVGGLMTGNPCLTAAVIGRRLFEIPYSKSQGARALISLSKQKALGTGARLGTSQFGRRFFGDQS